MCVCSTKGTIALTHTYIHTCIHTYVHTYMHTYMHTHIHACPHTYIHTYQAVIGKHGPDPEKGTRAWQKLESSVRNAALHITYAIKQKVLA